MAMAATGPSGNSIVTLNGRSYGEGESVDKPLQKTKTPGIYRRGASYVVKARDASGRMLTRSVTTMAHASRGELVGSAG